MSAMNEKFAGKVLLFDLDGTLADSMPIATNILLSFLDEHEVVYPDDLIKTLIPLGFFGVAKYYVDTFGIKMTAEETFQCFKERLERAYAQDVPLKKQVKETLLALKAQGVRMCVLTGSPHLFTDPCLQRTGVYELFEAVWSSDDFGLLKANPQIFIDVAKKLGVSVGDLVMVDDGINVIRTAKKAGVGTIGVYDSYSADDEKEMRSLADRYARSLSEIL